MFGACFFLIVNSGRGSPPATSTSVWFIEKYYLTEKGHIKKMTGCMHDDMMFYFDRFSFGNIYIFQRTNFVIPKDQFNRFLICRRKKKHRKKAVNHLSDSCSVYKTIIILFLVLYCCRSRVLIIEKRTEIRPILYIHPTFFSFFCNTILIGSFALPHHHLTTLKKSRISRCMYA